MYISILYKNDGDIYASISLNQLSKVKCRRDERGEERNEEKHLVCLEAQQKCTIMNPGYANSRKVCRLTLSTVRLVGWKEFCATAVERSNENDDDEKKKMRTAVKA